MNLCVIQKCAQKFALNNFLRILKSATANQIYCTGSMFNVSTPLASWTQLLQQQFTSTKGRQDDNSKYYLLQYSNASKFQYEKMQHDVWPSQYTWPY